MTGIETALLVGGLLGAVAGLVPRVKVGCATLLTIPLAMLIYTVIQLNDASRRPDALDALLYVFNPLWPSLGALLGFGLVLFLYGVAFRKKSNDR
ncbi:MAG: hypothetical protein B7Y88_13975 [Sphingomonadales bacterium 32-64-17]|nr:MAG: hypothetical protein B7Y88_13975 [Sphingomonadales bacterium 32-64-17]